ncbi:MAG TPA: glutamyl-tRNA reductase [Anaerolineae bacterium]
MSQHILMMGLNHATAPIQIREQVACTRDQLALILPQFISAEPSPITESAILSTCNRTEIYAVADEVARGRERLREFFETRSGLVAVPLVSCLYEKQDRDAVEHLLTVASGLDSLILGEFEILGQVRQAYEIAQQQKTLGPILTTLFHKALHAGKRARSETTIGQGAASVAFAAVELIRQEIGDLSLRRVLVIGSGEMGQRVAKNLTACGVRTLLVTSRTYEHAVEIADDLGGQALPFARLGEVLHQADVVITATGAPHIVLPFVMIAAAMAERPQRSLCLVDLAVPRDVEPAVAQIPNVHLYTLDDLQGVVRSNVAERAKQVEPVRIILAEELEEYWNWWMERRAVPVIAGLRERAETIRQLELDKALRRLGHLQLNERDRNIISALSAGIVKKLLAAPTVNLKERVSSGDGQIYLDTLSELFELTDEHNDFPTTG